MPVTNPQARFSHKDTNTAAAAVNGQSPNSKEDAAYCLREAQKRNLSKERPGQKTKTPMCFKMHPEHAAVFGGRQSLSVSLP
eukprot:1343564-Amphidinium_carterae.1